MHKGTRASHTDTCAQSGAAHQPSPPHAGRQRSKVTTPQSTASSMNGELPVSVPGCTSRLQHSGSILTATEHLWLLLHLWPGLLYKLRDVGASNQAHTHVETSVGAEEKSVSCVSLVLTRARYNQTVGQRLATKAVEPQSWDLLVQAAVRHQTCLLSTVCAEDRALQGLRRVRVVHHYGCITIKQYWRVLYQPKFKCAAMKLVLALHA